MNKMDYDSLNNNIEIDVMKIDSDYQVEMGSRNLVPTTAYENCSTKGAQCDYNFRDEYCHDKKFGLPEDEKHNVKGIVLPDVRVIMEKLPDSILQQYLAKKTKKSSIGSLRGKFSYSSVPNFVKKGKHCDVDIYVGNETVSSSSDEKENAEIDQFVKGLCNPTMQQYLANTEMGNFMEMIKEPFSQKYLSEIENDEIDCFTKNFGNPNVQRFPIQSKEDDKTHDFMESFSSSVEQSNFEIEKYQRGEKFMSNSTKKNNLRKIKHSVNGKHGKKNITLNLCRRFCPKCLMYVHEIHPACSKVKCSDCKVLTFYECKKCKKQAQSYSGMLCHLSYRCVARGTYECAHCSYSAKRKSLLALHINRSHQNLKSCKVIAEYKDSNAEKVRNEPHQGSEDTKLFETLIVLRKQKRLKCKSEWYVENVKRGNLRVDKSLDSSSPLNTDPESTRVREMSQFYCEYCNRKEAIKVLDIKSDIYCRCCGTILVFKCIKCTVTCLSYKMMKYHLEKICGLKKKTKESFYCSECNYRSVFQGLVINHQNQVHNFEKSEECYLDNLAQNYSENN